MIQAIETTYRGTAFRSRLEARWACFFDMMAIDWEYEPEDFSLPDRGYRPDFWLRTCESWAEIKPAGTPMNHELAAAIQEETGSPLLWISGPPMRGAHSICLCDFGTVETVEGLEFAESKKGELWLADAEQTCCLPLPPRWLRYDDDFPLPASPRIEAAYRAAMGYRFEGGLGHE